MKLLSDLLYKVRLEKVSGNTHLAISEIEFDSRKVVNFGCFVAIKGAESDGHQFISKAIENGAIAVICESFPEIINENITYVKVKDSSSALAIMAGNFYNDPSRKIKLIGITGTNGKTTTATLLYQLFQSLGKKCGLISTVRNYINTQEIKATHTTPDSLNLNKLLAEMVDNGCTYCFMEVSSHAVVQKRIEGLHFTGAGFTNITHDHLDYHKTFENYLGAKKEFFDVLPSAAFALSNKDDRNGQVMLQNTKAEKKYYSLTSIADFKGKVIESSFSGLLMNIDNIEVWLKLIGNFNANNIMLIYGIAMLLGENKTNVLTALSNLNPVDGRFQFLKSDSGTTGIVDYAHTPDALQNVLNTIRQISGGKEKVITVVGCGGDRDKSKRPLMANIACSMSDKVILTSDNPRSEEPVDILNEMQKGIDAVSLKKALIIADRREAIKTACMLAQSGDIILVAGKGHEKYQEIKGEKFPFDDLEEIKNAFKNIN
jgi:UDP-N-acetylmuramoyl-L-alanyl-D-glutamate--2,6-diaminopimelate ligase